MLDREIGLAGPDSEKAAQQPATGVTRVERQRSVEQPDHSADILAEASQDLGGVDEDARLVLPHVESLPSEIDGLASGFLRLFSPAVVDEPGVAIRRPGECRGVMVIDRDRLLEQSQSLGNPVFGYRTERCKRPCLITICDVNLSCSRKSRAGCPSARANEFRAE